MKIVIILMMVFVAGCSSDIKHWKLKSMIDQCEDKGGIIEIYIVLGTSANCGNGERVEPKRPK